jgi:hypothetical protein
MTPQPLRFAGVYFYRAVLHDNNDADAARILQSLIPALGNRRRGESPVLLINDFILPENANGDVSVSEVHQQKQLDVLMMVLSGAKARTGREWRELLGRVDVRLEIVVMVYSELKEQN